jgi:hypothetical protein
MYRLLFTVALAARIFAQDRPPDLLEAAKKGRTKDVETLLATGAPIESKDKEGRTPLMLAAQYGRTATVELLLKKGANPRTRDDKGWDAYMLALLSPSGGLVHTVHDSVLRLLPQPKHFRVLVTISWTAGATMFSSCFMRPPEMLEHMRSLRPDAMMAQAFARYAGSSGKGLIAIAQIDARGTSEHSNLAPPADTDAILDIALEPGASCVQGMDHLIMPSRARLSRTADGASLLDRAFGEGVKIGMKTENARNPNQHGPIYEAWAKSEAKAIYWAVVEALLSREW